MGLAVAEKLAGYGAHVTIVSRNQSNLDIALAQVEVRISMGLRDTATN